jgi:hypothetical protein
MSNPTSVIPVASTSNMQASEVNESTTSLAVAVHGNHEPVPRVANEGSSDDNGTAANHEIRNASASKIKQLRSTIGMWFLTVALTAFIFTWTYEILLAEIPSFGGQIVTSGSKSNVTITVLAQVFVQLVHMNLTSSFEVLSYQLASKREGVSMPTFLQLNPATTYLGSLSLSRIRGKHYIWAIQR